MAAAKTSTKSRRLEHQEEDTTAKSQSTGKRKRATPSTPRKPKGHTVDLTEETTPSGKKSKTTPQKSPEKEKRLKRYRDHAPGTYLEKLHRAVTQRMFVVERTPCGHMDCPEENISMAGTTGNIYNVHINKAPSCTCPDNRKGNQCKHIVYVLHNVLKAPEHLQYQLAFLSSELQTIFAAAPSPIASASSSDETDDSGGAKRRQIDGDCPICFTPFEPETESIVYCKAACGNNIHADCFEQWATSQAGKDVRCVYCRSVWQGDEEQVMRIVKDKARKGGEEGGERNAEGYVNVSSELGLSGTRGMLEPYVCIV